MSEKIKIGQVVYRDNGLSIGEHTVSKVSRKYFYLDIPSSEDYPISIEDFTHHVPNYGQRNWSIYLTKEEIHDKHEKTFLYAEIQRKFRPHLNHLSKEQLRAIAKILGIEYKEAI